tara:strand:- start:1378 stop:2196 length:819 start_codon:yes stop_codon:yes gene_type:complete
MAKQRKGVGLTSFATGFAKGASQGIQMGMYRAMQQQKAGMTENEELAKKLKAIPTAGWSSEKKAKLNTTIFALGTDPNLDADDRQVFTDEWLTIIADPATYEKAIDPIDDKIKNLLGTVKDPRSKEDLINLQYRYKRNELTPDEVNEVLQESGMVSPERFEAKPGYTMTAAEVETADLPTAPLGQVWWMGDDGNPTLKGKAKGVDKALKPVRMEHMPTGKAEWFNWDPAQGNFIYQSGAKAGDTLEAEELTNYKPPTSSDFLEMMRMMLLEK